MTPQRSRRKVTVPGRVTGFAEKSGTDGANARGEMGLTPLHLSAHRADGRQAETGWAVDQMSDLVNNHGQTKLLGDRIRFLENELQRTREESFQAGYDEGREAGLREAERRVDEVAKEFEGMIASLKEQYGRALEKMDEPLLKLARKLAEKVIGIELEQRDELDAILLQQIRRLLHEVANQNKMVVRVNPDRLRWVTKRNLVEELKLPSSVEISFVGDRTLKPGECLLETEDYIVHGTFSDQLRYLEEQLINGKL